MSSTSSPRQQSPLAVVTLLFAAFAIAFNCPRQTWGQSSASTAALEHARLLLASSQADSARTILNAAISQDSMNASLWLELAEVQQVLKQPRGRRQSLEWIRQLPGPNPEARVALANDFFNGGQLDSAAIFAHEAIARSGQRSARAYYWLGRIHDKSGHADSAFVYYQAAWMHASLGGLF